MELSWLKLIQPSQGQSFISMLDTSDFQSSSSYWVEIVLPGIHPVFVVFHWSFPDWCVHSSMKTVHIPVGVESLNQIPEELSAARELDQTTFLVLPCLATPWQTVHGKRPRLSNLHLAHGLECPGAWDCGSRTGFLLMLPSLFITVKWRWRFKAP